MLAVEDGAGNPLAEPSTQHGYTGRWVDPDTGLQYNRGRWYDPAVGRWLSEDPIGFAGGDYNLYRYVGNSPTNFVDPDGLEAFPPEWSTPKPWDDGEFNYSDYPWWQQPLIALDICTGGPGSRKLFRNYEEWVESNRQRFRDNAPALGQAADYFDYSLGQTQGIGLGVPIGTVRPVVPGHHIATNKNWISSVRGGPWSPRFAEIFKKAGMTLDDAANIVDVPGHAGPHPEAYHAEVYRQLQKATDGLSGKAYKDALLKSLNDLACQATTKRSKLNRLLTGE